MSHDFADFDWTRFTGRPRPSIVPEKIGSLAQKTVLITGAGGSIGSALAQTLAVFPLRRLPLLDHAEAGLAALQRRFAAERNACTAEYTLGDIRDVALLRSLFQERRVDIVFHAAACKHVPLLETNPFTAASINVLGTRAVLEEAVSAEVEHFVLLSTDKAADPISVLGVTKRVAELVTLTAQKRYPSTKVLRLCNVLGSAGSVAPIFAEQLRRGERMTVTHPEAKRFFISPEEAVQYLLRVLTAGQTGSLWIPNLSAPQTVESLASFLAGMRASNTKGPVYTGLRPGDKLIESLWSAEEAPTGSETGALIRLQTLLPWLDHLVSEFNQLADAVSERNLAKLLEVLQRLVPTYRPSRTVLGPEVVRRESFEA